MDTALIAAALIAYSLGSLPFAYWVSYTAKGIDPRTVGDGNPGAKNVFLQVGHVEGVLVCLLDVSKGSAAVLLGKRLGLGLDGCLVAGAFAAGRVWPRPSACSWRSFQSRRCWACWSLRWCCAWRDTGTWRAALG